MPRYGAFADELRRWREARRFSQLALSAEAEVSQRHLSFLETGRSKPSREMVLHLGRSLDLSLRDQNNLLVTAGYAAEYRERSLDDPDLDEVRHILEVVLAAYGSIPAYVIDRGWDIVLANPAALALASLAPKDVPLEIAANAMRLSLHPDGLRDQVVDWPQFAATLMHRLEREAIERPFDERVAALLAEAKSLPGMQHLPERPAWSSGHDLMVPLQVQSKSATLTFVSMIATIGAPFDITLEELRLETLLPADAETEAALRDLV